MKDTIGISKPEKYVLCILHILQTRSFPGYAITIFALVSFPMSKKKTLQGYFRNYVNIRNLSTQLHVFQIFPRRMKNVLARFSAGQSSNIQTNLTFLLRPLNPPGG